MDDRTGMPGYLKGPVTFAAACIVGVLYSGLIALISSKIGAALIALPIWILLLWICFWKWNLLRLSAFLGALPVSVLAFEIFRTLMNPPIYAYQMKVQDRSHFKPGIRTSTPEGLYRIPDGQGWGLKEILIGKDGFRADPSTGRGNPERCSMALFGDSMIYGSGLPYSDTLGPGLAAMGFEACVFGVSGNATVDYLETLRYVKKRIEKGGHVAFYLYVYNDFVSFSKYARRRFGSLSSSFVRLSRLVSHIDAWRQTTYTFGLLPRKSSRRKPSLPIWEIKIGKGKTLKFYYPRNPAVYVPPSPLSRQQQTTLKWFFEGLRDVVGDRSRRVSIVFIPDNPEAMANFAQGGPTFQDLDPRRIEALQMCRTFFSSCEDLAPYLFKRTFEEGKNPYFIDDRHFSAFGTRVLAEHYLIVAERTLTGSAAG
jgi:hypothetical protein